MTPPPARAAARANENPVWFDAHLDLGCLAVNTRDMRAGLDRCGGPWPPPAVTLPSLKEGAVRFALATIFTEADGTGAEGYPSGDAARAHAVGRAQLEAYLTWRDAGDVAIDLPGALAYDPETGETRAGLGVSRAEPPELDAQAQRISADGRLHIGVLIEGADPIRSPEDVAWWKERGACAVGLAWWKPSRYAGGNGTTTGLTDAGRDLVRALDAAGIVHDASHLSDRSLDDLFAITEAPVIASHSNCRALLGPAGDGRPNQRHLTDEAIREIARRGGVIGLNLFTKFLRDGERATIDDAIAHVERICDLAGDREHIGLGSDMDGGFSAEEMPVGIATPSDLERMCDALRSRGWSARDLDGFRRLNWLRFWRGVAQGEGRGARTGGAARAGERPPLR